jgi:hypothetical protein
MPESDLEEAEKCYNAMHENVRSGHADRSVKSSENRCCHVRPHARDGSDTIMTPYGKPVVKKSFWLNAEYIALEIKRLIEENS